MSLQQKTHWLPLCLDLLLSNLLRSPGDTGLGRRGKKLATAPLVAARRCGGGHRIKVFRFLKVDDSEP